ncbi:ATP-binding cassette domain-containing protein [Streptomyces sp. NPDC004542]|uniref:ATP-binding cassette domain-containing protein n=1 Tax=Streptomyces sp. NPDC004542 TaxID=3154281 RepID=UPI0033B0FA4D
MLRVIQAIGLTSNARKGCPPAVDDVSFEARPGCVTALLGTPGAGRTTTLRLMLELEPGRGITYFRGLPLHRIAHPSREVGVLLGDVPGHPARSVRGHLRMLCAAAGVPARRADEVLEAVGLVSLREERLDTLSRGTDRRLGLACALLPDPHTLVLDDPTDGLSVREGRWLHGMLRAHAAQGGTVLFTTSDPKEAARAADRVVTLERGRLLADQDAREFGRTRLRPRVAVRSPHAPRLAALLAKEARTARRSVEVVPEGGNHLSVYGSTTAEVGETAFRHGILVHQLADEVGDMGPGAGAQPADGQTVAVGRPSAGAGPRGADEAASASRRQTADGHPVVGQPRKGERSGTDEAPETGRAQAAHELSAVDRAHGAHETPPPDRAQATPERSAADRASTGGALRTRGQRQSDGDSPAGDAAPSIPAPSSVVTVTTAAATHSAQDSATAQAPAETSAVPAAGRTSLAETYAPHEGHDPADGRTAPNGAGPTAGSGPAFGHDAAGPVPDPLSPLPPPIAVRAAPSPLRPLRYELRRACGIGTGFLTCGAVLVVSALAAVLLARLGHTPQARLFAAWPRELPLPPAALGAALLGSLAFGDEFRHPALAADRGTVPRRLGLLTAKLLVSGATAGMLAFLTVGCDAEALYIVYGRELTQVPGDWLALGASWFGLVVGCAWAGVLAAGVFRSTTAGLAAVVAVPVVVVPLVEKALGGPAVRMAADFPLRMHQVLLLQWPFGGERYLLAAARVIAQPVGGALALSLTALLCAYLLTTLRSRLR